MRNKRNAIIATSSGEGISGLFLELGADAVIYSENPDSIVPSDFAEKIKSLGAEHSIILPNTPQLIERATQAASLVSPRRVEVFPTRSFAEGYAVLASMPRAEEAIMLGAASANPDSFASAVRTADIVCRSSGGFYSEFAAICNGAVAFLARSAEAVLLEAVESILLPAHKVLTLIVGEAVSDTRRVFVTERLGEIYREMQIIVYIGGQKDSEYYVALR